ncbi:hypothetical protein Q2406_03245 [Klebsiella pneumoniae]|nr:hypothetical protein [Klebsiella pneumoniae]
MKTTNGMTTEPHYPPPPPPPPPALSPYRDFADDFHEDNQATGIRQGRCKSTLSGRTPKKRPNSPAAAVP